VFVEVRWFQTYYNKYCAVKTCLAGLSFCLISAAVPRMGKISRFARNDRQELAVTLKRFFKEKDKIRLQPANPAYPPQFYDDVRIQGKLIGVIRKLD